MHFTDLATVLVSALFHAIWSVAIKGSRDSLAFNLLQIAPATAAGVVLLLAIDLETVPRAVWPIVAATGVAHGLYLYWMSRAYSLADISLVYPIARSTPALLPLVAIPLLGESISWQGGLGIATVVGGMWFVALGEGLRLRALAEQGTIFAVLTLLTTVAYGLLDKSAMVHLDGAAWTSAVPRAVFYFFMTCVASSFVFVPLALRRLDPGALSATFRSEWRASLLAITISLVSYALLLQALRSAPASYVVAARQSSVFFVLILSVIRLGERPGRARLAGAAATVGGVALIAGAP